MLVPCPSCGATNRVPDDSAGRPFRCSRCKTPLPGPGAVNEPLIVTDATFMELVERSPVPVLLDLWAAWCGPCRAIAPAIAELARELAPGVRVAKLDVDENYATAERLGVRNIPTLLIFRDGREVDRLVGALPKAEILRRVRAVAPLPGGVQ